MALIPGFAYDIFISYAHVDNEPFSGQKTGWIKLFYEDLKAILAKRFGRPDMLKIWFDERNLDGGVVFDQSIEEGIKKSAIMICLNSPGYLKSDYCKKELETFYKKAQAEKNGLIVANRSRILNVLLNNIPLDQWPTELNGTSGFHFHDDSDFGETVEPGSEEFKTQMKKMKESVWNLLNDFEKMQATGAEQQQARSEDDKNAFTIFLGEVADTLRTARKRIITELEKKGFKVVTGIPPPEEASAHEQATNEALQKANLTIHLLDEYSGREIVDEPNMWYPQKQAELGLKSGKSQMIWVPAEIDFANVEDEKYKLFLQDLETGKTPSEGYEFVRGSKSTLAKQIIDFAEQVKARQMQKKAVKGKVSVLLDTHFNDQQYAFDLSKTLFENSIQPFINPQEDDPRKNIDLMGERLSQVNKLIFLYGSVSKEWVLERMSAALQLIITKNYPIEDFFIYMAPPRKEAGSITLNQRFLKVNVIDSSNNPCMDKEELRLFLNAITAGAV